VEIERRLRTRLKEVRAAAGLTRAELAVQVGVSRKTINTVENGVFIPQHPGVELGRSNGDYTLFFLSEA
jgi:DNA-binding XRE family transcriptional regulator